MNFFEADVLSRRPLRAGCNNRVFEPEVSTTPETDTILLGIRPEDITVSTEEKTDTEAIVELVELESSIVWIDMRWKEIRLKGKASIDESISAGDRVYIKMPVEKIHAFDMETGKRL